MRYYSALCDNTATNGVYSGEVYTKKKQDLSPNSTTNQESHQSFNYDFRGIIIPPDWKKIMTAKGKKLSRGALELYAIIVSWHIPKKVKDKNTKKIIFISKFEGNELKKNYAYFTKELGVGQEQVRRYFVELKAANLVSMELRTVWHRFWRYENTICIKLNKEADHFKKNEVGACDKEAIVFNRGTSASSQLPMQLSLGHIIKNSLEKTENSRLKFNTVGEKKFCLLSHLNVESTPPKSGIYIKNNYFKTNISIIRSDISGSNLKNSTFVYLNTQPEIILSKQAVRKEEGDNKIKSESIQLQNKSSIRNSYGNQRKPLSFFHPLCEQDAEYLRKSSKRSFTLCFINKLLLKLSSLKPNHGFYTKDSLLSYLTRALVAEITETSKANRENFNFQSQKGEEEYKKKHRHNYLKVIELSRQTDYITRIKRRIIGLSAGNDEHAYHILTNCTLPYIQNDPRSSNYCNRNYNNIITTNNGDKTISYKPLTDCTIKISDFITEDNREIIMKATQEVLGQGINIIFKKRESTSIPLSNNFETSSELKPVISSPLWQKIRDILKQRYDQTIDQLWFSKLDIEVIARNKQINIYCPSAFVRDWVKNNYDDAIEKAITKLAITEKDLLQDMLFDIGFSSIRQIRFEYVAT